MLPPAALRISRPAERLGGLAASRGDRGTAEVRLEMPLAAARARRPVELDDRVAELAAQTAAAAVRLAVDEDAAADAGADRDHEEVARALGGAVARLAERREMAVVVDGDLLARARHDERTHVDAGERQVGAELHGLAQEVDLTRDADAHACDFRGVRAGLDLFDEVDDGVDDRERTRLGREPFGVLDDAALALDQTDGDSSAADVDADRVAGAHAVPPREGVT